MPLFLKQAREKIASKIKVLRKIIYWCFCWIESQLIIVSSRTKYRVYTWGGWSTEDNSPALKLEDACLLGPLRSNPAIPTKAVSDRNQLGPGYKQVAKFTAPGGTSPCYHWWNLGQGALNRRSPNTGVGRAAPQWRTRSTMKNIGHRKGDRLQREPLHFPSPSSPFTQMVSLHTQKPVSTPLSSLRSHVRSITQSTWLHFVIHPKSNHLTISTASTLV